ncbi:MAG: LytR/AlgR family response regulator transcription factor [Terriglobales bacterium]
MIPEIRTIIADYEPSERARLRLLLESEAGVEVLAECDDGGDTLSAVQAHRPDLLLLDARLLGSDGLPVLSQVPPAQRPLIIFTSEHDGYAARAFEVQARDYLLKPLDQERLHLAIERIRAELLKAQDRRLTSRLLNYLAEAKSESPMDKRLVVKSEGRVVFLRMDEIEWIEAAANYVRLQAGSQSYLMREGIGHIASRLDPNQFLRIHRSIIVNVRKIKELQPCNRGEYMVVLTTGKELSCSRGYRARLRQLIAAT